jgi:1-phosphatidylinositol-3-phosphate 5-kinase
MVEMEDYAILQLTTTDDDDDDGEESDEEASDDDADGASSSLICSRYRSDADERQKAMVRAMNGQLKMLAARFLESAGIDSCCWLDVVTSLSWEAALFIRPDATAGNEMDPCSYLKVKCLAASAAPACSEVVRGLVFSKKAAHKHMPTRCHNPRLLLLGGALGDSGHTALSSLSSVQQEKKHLQDSVRRMVEICRPNVIMVEKTVSRDIQELLLEEGVTLVPDMKLTRLRRIARCSASPIILDFPSDEPSLLKLKPKLKRCDYFHIEKVAGTCKSRQSNKTLMFLQGFHKPLGCTVIIIHFIFITSHYIGKFKFIYHLQILLRGANSEELKKVKQVMLYTVFAAYHLVLETSFFEDQRVILDNHVSAREPPTHGETVITISSKQIDHLNSTDDQSQPKRSFHYQNIYLPVLTSSQEATTDHHRKEAGALQCNQDMVLHTQFGSGENVDHLSSDPQNEGNQHITLLDDHDPWVSGKHDEQPSTPLENVSDVDEVDDVLESQSILILLSSQCITKQVICEQSHLSRINYYGNSDVSLGRYLQDILQNQVKNLFLPLFCLYISFCPTPFGEYAHDSCFFLNTRISAVHHVENLQRLTCTLTLTATGI